ncbi:MAG TPA: hypothetical protein ENK61_09005 [Devosia sp.]|nr:hypothetical protein [Devosia sp.]
MSSRRKFAFVALLLPASGLLAILPPLVSIRNAQGTFFGFPTIIAYLFGVWLLLIVAAFVLQRNIPEKLVELNQNKDQLLD